MRKVLSIVLALLMVSMMIPSMAFAEGEITLVSGNIPTAALVATEDFTLTAIGNVTVKVNASVFDITGGVEDAETNIETATYNDGDTITVTVADKIPEAAFESTIRVELGDVKENITIAIDDVRLGDVNNSNTIDIVDVVALLEYSADPSAYNVSFMSAVGDINSSDTADIVDVVALLEYSADNSVNPYNLGDVYVGGNDLTVDIADPDYDATTEPEKPEAVKLDAVTGIIAMVEGTTVHYEFVGNANASSYAITVNGVAAELADATKATGSFAVTDAMNVKADGTDVISVVAVGDQVNYLDSDPAEEDILPANSGTLAAWLEENELQDVVITVYEIK